MNDYPDHPGTSRLIAAMIPSFDSSMSAVIGYGVPIMLETITECTQSGQIALAKTFARAARLLEQRNYPDLTIWGGWGAAMFNLASGLAKNDSFQEAVSVIEELERGAQTEDAFASLGKAYSNVVIDAVNRQRDDVAWPLVQQALALALRRPEVGRWVAPGLVSGVQLAPSVAHAETMLYSALELLKINSRDSDLIGNIAAIALNVANRAQREERGEIALRTFSSTLSLIKQLSSDVIPAAMIARVAIPAGAVMAYSSFGEISDFASKLKTLAEEHCEDEDVRHNCLTGLYNCLCVLRLDDDKERMASALSVFASMCQIGAMRPKLDSAGNDCLAAAYRFASTGKAGLLGPRLRETLQVWLPESLAPDFLASREESWGVDLAAFKE
jgi:hypothetical protein